MIMFNHVSKWFPDGTVAVENLDLHVPRGQITVLLGPSGSGKTTTLRMVNRLVEPTTGTVSIDGRNVRSLPAHELRRSVGYVIQHTGLFPHRTVVDNVATVPSLLGWDKERQQARARELLDLVGLGWAVAHRYPRELSGGQQQRVGVARALAADPPVLLADEPFAAVDPVRRTALQQQFRRLQRDLGKTILFVTHDVDEAVLLGDQIAVFGPGGQLVQVGATRELLARPATAFVAEFLGNSRGQGLLSQHPANHAPTAPQGEGGAGGWFLDVDGAGRPTAWRSITPSATGGRPPVPVQTVGPNGSVRDLLDSALSSPAATAVRVDTHGGLQGVVPWFQLTTHILALLEADTQATDTQATDTQATDTQATDTQASDTQDADMQAAGTQPVPGTGMGALQGEFGPRRARSGGGERR